MSNNTLWYAGGTNYPIEIAGWEPKSSIDIYIWPVGETEGPAFDLVWKENLHIRKREALLVISGRIYERIKWLHDEGMSDREYDRVRDHLEATLERIKNELEYGEIVSDEQMLAEMRERKRERGEY